MPLHSAYLQATVSNETKVAGNPSAQFCVTTIAQQSFHVALCVTSNLKTTAFFAETVVSSFVITDFKKLVSSVYDPLYSYIH
jgi:hypothetical protein